jgi:hypothetical protein
MSVESQREKRERILTKQIENLSLVTDDGANGLID